MTIYIEGRVPSCFVGAAALRLLPKFEKANVKVCFDLDSIPSPSESDDTVFVPAARPPPPSSPTDAAASPPADSQATHSLAQAAALAVEGLRNRGVSVLSAMDIYTTFQDDLVAACLPLDHTARGLTLSPVELFEGVFQHFTEEATALLQQGCSCETHSIFAANLSFARLMADEPTDRLVARVTALIRGRMDLEIYEGRPGRAVFLTALQRRQNELDRTNQAGDKGGTEGVRELSREDRVLMLDRYSSMSHLYKVERQFFNDHILPTLTSTPAFTSMTTDSDHKTSPTPQDKGTEGRVPEEVVEKAFDAWKPHFVLFQDDRTKAWRGTAISEERGRFLNRGLVDPALRGLRNEGLRAVVELPPGPELFVHASGFTCGTASKEGTLALIKYQS